MAGLGGDQQLGQAPRGPATVGASTVRPGSSAGGSGAGASGAWRSGGNKGSGNARGAPGPRGTGPGRRVATRWRSRRVGRRSGSPNRSSRGGAGITAGAGKDGTAHPETHPD